jgi:hypothetical protein
MAEAYSIQQHGNTPLRGHKTNNITKDVYSHGRKFTKPFFANKILALDEITAT